MAYVNFSPEELRAFASKMEVAPSLFRQIAADMEESSVSNLKLQVKTAVYRYIDPLNEWAEEVAYFAQKAIKKAAKQQAAFNAGVAYRQQKEAEEAPKKPRKKGGGK